MPTPLSDERVTGYANGTLVIHPPDVQSMAQELMAYRLSLRTGRVWPAPKFNVEGCTSTAPSFTEQEKAMKVPHRCELGCTIMPTDHLPEGSY